MYNFWIRAGKSNDVSLISNKIYKSRLNIVGSRNRVNINNTLVSDSIISITGNENTLNVEEGVKLRKATITIRGNNCEVEIKQNTTFASVRIVNVGTDNKILIGQNCLFSDYIEIWGSDTHAIFDKNNKWINKERPISIGDNVWVGSHVKILKGVTVADGAILGMGSMITKDVSERVIVAGTPLRVIKEDINWSLDYPIQE
ncbi:acyltransferase [Zobellia roscoffensis]|uniref:acyltransferase n=1 Tax=Zobellia roscoffensis TaxID=2779508 RepID=UPI00188CD411|nr:acyltransferase [Zobellia roscoffensis]